MDSLDVMVYRLLAIVPAFTLHELGHALAATWLGDPTPRWRGRVTLNPLAHVDWIGLLLLLVVGFGWAKPVEVNPGNFRNSRAGMALTTAAGPLANLLLAFAGALGIFFGGDAALAVWDGRLMQFLFIFVHMNIVLVVFNLLPVPPLDGSRLLAAAFPRSVFNSSAMQQYGGIILMLLLVTRMLDTPLVLATRWLGAKVLSAGQAVAGLFGVVGI